MWLRTTGSGVRIPPGAPDARGPLAGPGEVLVSSTVKDLVAGSGLRVEDRGEHQLKGIAEPWRVLALATPGAMGSPS